MADPQAALPATSGFPTAFVSPGKYFSKHSSKNFLSVIFIIICFHLPLSKNIESGGRAKFEKNCAVGRPPNIFYENNRDGTLFRVIYYFLTL